MRDSDRTTMAFSPCTEAQLQRIHQASLEVLERTGVAVQEDEARSLLLDAGAHESAGNRVRIPSWMVKRALASAPERVTLWSRDGRPAMPMEPGGRVFFGTGSDTPNTIDLQSGQRRPAVKDDTRRMATLCDALENMDFVMSMGIASDVPRSTSFVHEFDAMLRGTDKPMVFTAADNRDMQTIYEIALVLSGSPQAIRERPWLLLYSEPLSPLQHTKMGTEKLLFCAERGIPCVYVCGLMAGSTGPATLAGSLAVGNAEGLSGLVISQLKRPGAPFVYGGNVTTMDMRTSVLTYASPEFSLTNSVFAALGRYYRLPVWGLAGAADSKVVDAQAGSEATLSILSALLSGGNLVHDIGYLESGLTSSMEMILLGDEVIPMCRRFVRGVALDDASFALDLVDEIGPGGHFLESRHTRDTFRKEHWITRFMDRQRFPAWQTSGGLDMADRLNAAARAILDKHAGPTLSEDRCKEIGKILRTRETEDARLGH